MNTGIILGILLIATGALSSGSFAVPFGKVKNWKWETSWLIFSVGAYIIFPLTACFIFAPDFSTILKAVDKSTIFKVFIFGAIYGVGNLSFGLALRYLGLSLGYALSLGLMLAIGTLIPPLMDGRLQAMLQHDNGMLLIWGVLIALLGTAFSAGAGYLKDKTRQGNTGGFDLKKGVLSAILVGFTGSAMSLGFEQGEPVAAMALRSGVDPLFTIMPVLLVLLSGTFVTTLIWCIYLGWKSKSLKDYTTAETPAMLTSNYLLSLSAGLLWFSQFILFGMGKSKMGPYTFTSWGILMALTIAFATIWGLIRNEWKGASFKTYLLMLCSLIILIVSAFMIGISGSE